MRWPVAIFALVASLLSVTYGAGQLSRFAALELEIENKRNEKGRKIPDEFIPDFRDQVLAAIVAEHLFHRVGDFADPKVSARKGEESVVLLRLRIVDYTGAQNNAGVTAMAQFVDKATGQQVLEQKVRAQLRYDPGALSAALRKLARSTASLIRDHW